MNIRIQRPDLLGRPQAVEATCEVNIDESHRKRPILVERRAHGINGILPLRHGDNIDLGKPLVPHGGAKKVALKLSEQAVFPRCRGGRQNLPVVVEQASVAIDHQGPNCVGYDHQIILNIRPLYKPRF